MIKNRNPVMLIKIILLAAFLLISGCREEIQEVKEVQKVQKEPMFTGMRKQMVERQIAARGILDVRLLEAMLRVERHKFVPEDKMKFAYNDHPLPIV